MTGDQLRGYRRAIGLTQKELAAAIGMSANQVARMERGERPITTRTIVAVRLLAMARRVMETK